MVRRVALLAMALVGASLFAQQAAETPRLRTGTKLVVVDVTVTNRDHQPIHGLQREDFTLLEDGKAQTFKSFEEHSGLELVKSRPVPTLPPDTFSNITETADQGALNILLLDHLDTQPHDLARLRQELLKYIDKARPGTRMALFSLNGRLRLLQGFTDDKVKLRTALGRELPMSPHSDKATLVAGRTPGPVDGDEPGVIEAVNAWRTDIGVMHELARYGAGLAGRKNLLWFSGYFPMSFVLRPGDPMSCRSCDASIVKQFRQAADLLAASQIAVYPIDAHGLSYTKDGANDFDRDELAAMTGGRAFYNENFMDQVAAEAIDDGSSYYTITYSPSDLRWNGDYRKIEVKSSRPGLELHYRQGFYADDPNAPVKGLSQGQSMEPVIGAEAAAATNALKGALEYGSPGATQIEFTAKVQPAGAGAETSLAQGNQVNTGVKGPFRRYSIDYSVAPDAVVGVASTDGLHHAQVEFVAFVYGTDGKLVNTVGMTVKADLPTGALATGSTAKIPAHEEVSIPSKGEYLLRLAVHDLSSDRVGALEVPTSALSGVNPTH